MKRNKADWRRELLATRAAMPEAERRRASLAMVARVRGLPSFASAQSVLGYVPIGAEADVLPLLCEAVGAGRSIFVPADGSSEDAACWSPWRDGEILSERIIALQLRYPVIALVPGVGFDERGARLGRGRGFYDRALRALRHAGAVHAVGMAFEAQVVRRLPEDPWDERVDAVVSDTRVISSSGRPAGREVSACP
jgi:5-formyltetrahydrofolate cyclo-ligase